MVRKINFAGWAAGLLLMVCTGLQAGVSGTVVDGSTGQALTGAVVEIQGTSSKQVTGADGTFVLQQTTDILDPVSSPPRELYGPGMGIFTLNGEHSGSGWAGLPDGIYLVRQDAGLQQVVKAGRMIAGQTKRAGKAAAMITLAVTCDGYQKTVRQVADGTAGIRIELTRIAGTTGNFPDASTTGIRGAGLSYSDLKSSGSLSITVSGAVIDKLDISGIVRVKAPNVTIKRCRIRTSGGFGIDNQSTGLKVEYVEIVGVQGTNNGIQYNNYTARYCDISGSADGAKANGNTLIEHCYIHDMRKWTGTHNDCIQVTGGSNITFRNNRLMGPWQTSTSCIKMDSDRSALRDVLIEGNFLSGGSNLVYSGAKDGMPCPSNVRIINNTVHRDSFVWGYLSTHGCGGTTWSNNVWSDTGTLVTK